jgi:hypothetical protein
VSETCIDLQRKQPPRTFPAPTAMTQTVEGQNIAGFISREA